MSLSDSNMQRLYEALDAYTKEASEALTVPSELEDYKFSKRFERNMRRIIRRQRHAYFKYTDTLAKQVASIAVLMLVCLTITVFSIKGLREPFIDFVVETFEKFTSIFVEKDEPVKTAEFETMLPQYIPEGYEAQEPIIDDNLYTLIYKNDDCNLIYKQRYENLWLLQMNTESIEYEKMYINEIECVFYENNGTNFLIFNSDDYTFSIEGNVSKEELIKIAESIE